MKMNRVPHLLILGLALAILAQGQTAVDRFGKLIDDDIWARIEHFGSVVVKNPGSIGHAVIVKPNQMPLGQFLRYFNGIRDVWAMQGYPVERLVLHAQEKRGPINNEFWMATPNQKFEPPIISISSSLGKRLTKKTLFDKSCIDCSPAVPLNQFIFREGLDYFAKSLKSNPTTSAEIIIGRSEFLSSTAKEQSDLRKGIFQCLEGKHGIQRSRIKIRFINSMFAYFYTIPSPKKFKYLSKYFFAPNPKFCYS